MRRSLDQGGESSGSLMSRSIINLKMVGLHSTMYSFSLFRRALAYLSINSLSLSGRMVSFPPLRRRCVGLSEDLNSSGNIVGPYTFVYSRAFKLFLNFKP